MMAMQAVFRKLGKNWSHSITVPSQHLPERNQTNHENAIITAILTVINQTMDLQSTKVGTRHYNNSFGVNL